MKTLYIILGSAALVLLLVAGYLGFVPGLSGLLGASTPRDLGVQATEEHYASMSQKLGRTIETLPGDAEDSLQFRGSHPVDIALSSEEFTAARQHAAYKHSPLSRDFQARFHEAGRSRSRAGSSSKTSCPGARHSTCRTVMSLRSLTSSVCTGPTLPST